MQALVGALRPTLAGPLDQHTDIRDLLPEQGGFFDWRKVLAGFSKTHPPADKRDSEPCPTGVASENRGAAHCPHSVSPVSVAPVVVRFHSLDEMVAWAFSAPPRILSTEDHTTWNVSAMPNAGPGPTSSRRAQVFVGDLSGNVSERDLVDCFSNYGAVRSAYIKRDPVTGKCVGFGFVEFQHSRDAERARLLAHRLRICSRRIRLGPAYHRRNGYEVVAYEAPRDMTNERLHDFLAQRFDDDVFDPHGTFVVEPERLGPLWYGAERVVRIRFRQSWVADLIVQAGWIEWSPGVRSPVHAAQPYSICRNGVELQFGDGWMPPDALIRPHFDAFGAPIQAVLTVPSRQVAYVIFEASWRGIHAALHSMRKVRTISTRQVWCHHCKVSTEFLLAYGMALEDWRLRQNGRIPHDSHVIYIGCPATLPDLLVDRPC
ncbi:similar to heterogeneous nuclear ribonucleoprotein [Cyanidioschyzon merolae strain 10D]|jgi:hypothetical protein|uniref:Similar to heterogeneous nuclear ribonucleoprotein n=1 Tax=Cyanidioschyzon merolae (strain NIES-3377 / 10D) TaxID=280699 RepID=M1VMS8_CYAM1|nr:similar to heterogeneous nuclear ribonucleoprotein [Cyanidioschyzon merolae strain 10D]BAM83503.1 similar to heterogeneous nuclear ribonucleoprotein [Cyanidioschyzon merolae strain 10D]|eukprot:XP_005539539.1 similar to heterogeneous nuclear ribonucleoprotein [Cyanidioschyzon merolae strain 10D]